jgi:hypothetical protein
MGGTKRLSQRKNYSRYFIILQEDERGYGLSADKMPTGYAKLEVKNGKCKITFYVQNLKIEMKPYYIMLICNKKDERKLIKLSELNIDNAGRAEICKEFEASNIGGSGIAVDKVSGAAVVRGVESNLIAVLSGFTSTEKPKDWKRYELTKIEERLTEDDNSTNKDVKDFDKYEEEIEKIKKSEKVEINKEEKSKEKASKKESTKTKKDDKTKEKDEINKVLTEDIVNVDVDVIRDESKEVNGVKQEFDDVIEISDVIESSDVDEVIDENRKNETENKIKEEVEEVKISEDKKIEREVKISEDKKIEKEVKISEDKKIEKEVKISEDKKIEKEVKINEDKKIKQEIKINQDEKISYETNKNIENKYNTKKYKERVQQNEAQKFFNAIIEDLEPFEDKFSEIGRSKWFKVSVNSIDDMYAANSYNKYAMIYYPMINYYPYIIKHRHYIIGYKYDNSDNLKYIMYGIPGKRERKDQPFGGKYGFVSFVYSDNDMRGELGYWMLFYDFKRAVVVIPKNK